MKSIIAEKENDGWSVKVINTLHLSCEEDVKKLIKQQGLEVAEEFSHSSRIVTREM